MGSIIAGIIAIAKAIPALRDILNQLSAAWMAMEYANLRQEQRDAIKKAIGEHDQRDLEKSIGNPKAGMPSGDDGAVVLPGKPPGVH